MNGGAVSLRCPGAQRARAVSVCPSSGALQRQDQEVFRAWGIVAESGSGMGTRSGAGRAGNGTGLSSIPVNTAPPGPVTAQFDDREYSTEVVYSGSDQDSDSADDEDMACSGGDRRGVKRERREREVGHQSANTGGVSPGLLGAKPGKKTRGRVKIKMEFIDNKLRRYTTFSKRKTGIMKKVSLRSC